MWPNLVQKIPFGKARRHVLLGNVTNVFADEGFDFEFESVLEHQIEFLLPRLLVREPMREQSIRSPLSTSVIGPTMAPAFLAYGWSSSRIESSDTSTSSMIGSHSLCVSKVSSVVPSGSEQLAKAP